MRNIFDVNRSVAGHYVEFKKDSVDVSKGENSFSLNTSKDQISYYLDKAEAVADGGALKCTVSGWAFMNKNSAPVKSIYIAYNNKIIARAKPSQRIDVRINLDLTFDHCGFESTFKIPKSGNPNSVASLIIVGDSTTLVHHFKLTNVAEMHSLAQKITRIDHSVMRPEKPNFEHRIDAALMDDGALRIRGWCFLREEPEAEIYINFLKSGILLGETVVQTVSRPDVGENFALAHGYHLFGFEFVSHKLKELPLNPVDKAIDMLLVADNKVNKELIRIYSE